MSDFITQLSIKQLLSSSDTYIIPMYQRNYAWDDAEINQLIQDIIDYIPNDSDKENFYYIGTLVVAERESTNFRIYETIDGQQRMTTLSLLTSYLKNNHQSEIDLSWYEDLRINFENRRKSHSTFNAIFNGNIFALKDDETNEAILHGYELIQKNLKIKLKESNLDIKRFADYFFENVQIMRVKVPKDTDLNHYFEIMNNRGEQLEKHEILKAKMMEIINGIPDEKDREKSQSCLDAVWEACANMERYLQMGFPSELRNAIFGNQDWGKFNVSNFDDLAEKIHSHSKHTSEHDVSKTLNEIIFTKINNIEVLNDFDTPERFNTVVNFPNFLLHVLRVHTKLDIPLDDKKLISIFEAQILRKEDAIKLVKGFIFALLRSKYLFDQYIIKREFIKDSDGWSLKRIKWNDGGKKNKFGTSNYVNTFGDEDGNGENRNILMLLSAFHVSTPTLVYKHWLNAALFHLFYAEEICADSYLLYLKSIANAFLFDRYLANGNGADYYEMIYKRPGNCITTKNSIDDGDLKIRLTFENIENNFIFNYLDYLLWLKHKEESAEIANFEFTFRSSVEHYYPQNPMPGYTFLQTDVLNSFGNLCLISHSKNSRLSNFSPEAKKEYYKKGIDSIKQYFMMKNNQWNEDAIVEHYEEMKEVLISVLN